MKIQRLLSYVRRAVDDYDMIDDGDRIAVGISGGKDSVALVIALKALQRFYPKKFELEAITVSLGYEGMDFSNIRKICDDIGVNYTVVQTDIGEIIFDARKESNPCSLCAKMRKGALNDKVEELGCNKIALGHNRDDVIETFFMSLFYEGRINTFSPVTYLDRKKIYSIRPLMYVPERDVQGFINREGIKIVKNKCPVDGHTKREETKNFIKEQIKKYDSFEEKVFGAIKRSDIKGWKTENQERIRKKN
ncbi:MAG: tRNA 2-thiocytidine biosynthesis protein TtcA [Firmicutes bacterium]|nr:tRNA 2-thiocytidine biosynthesis protein TtcA [Bacillota bacterium]